LEHVLRENRISIEELLSAARQNGIGNISDIRYAIIEPNGKISVLDCGLTHIIVSDGEVNQKTLKSLGYDERWLKKQLDKENASLSEVFFFGIDDEEKTTFFKKG
jgi:uncharacterized membrane protein YcaP (DUF421 family)